MMLEDRIVRSIRQRNGVVVLRSDVAQLGITAQVGRVLAKLVASGALMRVAVQKNRLHARTRTPRVALCDKSLAVLHFPQKVQQM
ncbi:hypothetical protein [Burkholderia pyrrocinia]|uniref:hypothetical protein n=1 Tax=Burkholderia pyrrocinia TaxID=60550 RepID=UPI0012603087|nr:hypothetical protein [Burkholderia pyrrocinia]